jgi:hypothetical protein
MNHLHVDMENSFGESSQLGEHGFGISGPMLQHLSSFAMLQQGSSCISNIYSAGINSLPVRPCAPCDMRITFCMHRALGAIF